MAYSLVSAVFFCGMFLATSAYWISTSVNSMPQRPERSRCNPFLRPRCNSFVCPRSHRPVCGTDGLTYFNWCYLSKANCRGGVTEVPVSLAHPGSCSIGPVCRDVEDYMMCYEIYQPVCGSNNVTYSNKCYLNKANCQRPMGTYPIIFVHDGECRSRCHEIPCTREYMPVCGSDGKSYSNKCTLSVANCRLKESGSPLITIVHKGECAVATTTTTEKPLTCDDIVCTFQYDPVCGSDGQTYSNRCTLSVANCRLENAGSQPVTVVYEGECRLIPTTPRPRDCDQQVCTSEYDPVCGSDGKTYGNPCLLQVANCQSEESGLGSISQIGVGECATGTTLRPITLEK